MVSPYVFCGRYETIPLRDIYRQERKKPHIVSTHAGSFRGLYQKVIYYTPRAKENYQEWDFFVRAIIVPGQHTLLPFPFEQFTKLGRLLRGVG